MIQKTRRAQAEEKESEVDVENLSGYVLSFLITLNAFLHSFFCFFPLLGGCHDSIEHSFHGERQSEPVHHLINLCDAVESGTS